jgi:aldehyde dehydrogenase (NAD+)
MDTATGSDVATEVAPAAVPTAGAAEVVSQLRATFRSGRTRSLDWRRQQLAGIERFVAERESEIAQALQQDLGRPSFYAWLGDIAGSAAEAAFARKNLSRWARRTRVSLPLSMRPGHGFVQYEPLGVVLIIGPWNYPVYLTLGPLVAAIAAGNCAVIKPSEYAPASAALLARLLPQYVDPAAVTVVEGDAGTTQDLLAQGVDHAFFTGGTEIGKLVMAAAAPHLTPVTLELGGKSPVIVTASADLEVAARRIVWTKLLNSGQTCIAPDYVLADSRIRDDLVARVKEVEATFRGEESGTGLPIVNRRQFDRLADALDLSGGTVVLGGSTDADALTITPTVIVDPSPESPVMQQEIFGPILPVLTVSGLDEAISFVNARPKPLALYLFSKSKADQDRVLAETSSGGMVVNHIAMHCLVPQLPFGGVGASGTGAYHGRWGFEALSHRRAVLAKPSRPDPSLTYPPYTDRKMKLLRRFF